MRIENYKEEIELPQGITAEYKDDVMTLKGPKGESRRKLSSPLVDVVVQGSKILFSVKIMTKREKALVGTFRAHINNMINGVTHGHKYLLKVCSGHFPMNVSYSNNVFSIKNFIGEKIPRTLTVKPGVDLKVEGDIITVESTNKELAGQTAASIEKLTRRPGFDKRIFQDGVYITEKPKRVEE